MQFSVLENSQETVFLCRVLGHTQIFFCSLVCLVCPFYRCFMLGLPVHIIYLYLFCFRVLNILCIGISTFPVYFWLWLAWPCSIGLPVILMSMLVMQFSPSILFPVNADGINNCIKYWRPSPRIIHMIHWMVSSSYMSGCSAWPLMNHLNFHSIL